jgi:uncharacterized protein
MSDIVFEWDPVKSRANKAKHGVLFEEAKTVFLDENARVISDDSHSDGEERFVLLGISIASRVLVVCHCYRRADEVIRIISARRATASERLDYARFLA